MVGQGAAPAGVLETHSTHSGGAGAPPGGHYGLPARSLADGWPRVALVNEKRGRRRKEDAAMARREAPVLSRGSTALKEQWLRHLARHPPSIGGDGGEGTTAYPAPQRIRAMARAWDSENAVPE